MADTNTNNLTPEGIAAHLYEIYCKKVGGKAYNGDPLPSWDEFAAHPGKQLQVEGWRAVARAAIALCYDDEETAPSNHNPQ